MKNILWITIAISFAFQLSATPVEAGWPSVDFPSDAGITLQKGSTYNILWSSVNTDPVDIKLCNEIEPSYIDCFYDIALNVPNSGLYSWTVPASLPNNSNYVISVGKILVSGASSDFPFTISDQLQTPLLPPRLSYTIDGVRTSLSWTLVSGATGYKLYYAPAPYSEPESIAEIDMGTRTTLSADLWEGASFLVAVQSYNNQDISNYSNIETITIPYTSAPESPQLSYSLDGTKLTATWGAVPDATGYKLYYTLSAYTGQEAFLPVDVGNQTSFTYAGLSEGQTYSIAVVSYNTAGESSFSNIETFTPSTVTQGSSGEYDITYQMMRHDTRSSGDYYRGYLSFTKNGLPLTNQDFVNLSLSNSSGTTVPITLVSNGNVETYNSIKANCSNLSCTWDPPSIETGISFNVGALALDDYTVTVDMADKQFSTVIPYNEDITLPIVDDATMQAAWQDENLVLSWSNPISDPNWNKVNKLRVSLYDISGFYGILELDPSNSTLVVPSGLIKDIEDYGDGTLYRWRIQTLSYTNDPRNSQNARGWSNTVYLQ